MPRQRKNAGKSTCSRALLISVSLGCLLLPQFAAVVNAEPLEEVFEDLSPDETETEDYDPWESFNEKMFNFNYYILDRYVIKPVAKVYDQIVLDGEKQAIQNLFDNIAMPRRFLNSLLQGKFKGAGRELARFLINSTLGVAGFADVAKYQFHIERGNEDTGQTFGFYGAGPGPYLVLPFLAPLTVRDGIGYVFDIAMDPLTYFFPITSSPENIAISFGRRTEKAINDRALNLDKYESVEESTVDLYSAIRNAYLARRKQLIAE